MFLISKIKFTKKKEWKTSNAEIKVVQANNPYLFEQKNNISDQIVNLSDEIPNLSRQISCRPNKYLIRTNKYFIFLK